MPPRVIASGPPRRPTWPGSEAAIGCSVRCRPRRVDVATRHHAGRHGSPSGAARPPAPSGRYRARHAARLRAPVHRLRLRAGPSADAAPVRAGDRPVAVRRGGAGTRAGAGARRRARVVPHAGATSRRSSASRGSVRRPARRASATAATIRPSPACTRPARRWPVGRCGRSRRSCAGDVEHAFHPGGGLHHAMPDRASGFCIYDDPALAIARARRDGLRVLYLDLDVHHGDGVQAIHAADPGVMTVSLHETGRYLFPGTGDADEIGEGTAAGTVVNVPFEPFTGADPWLRAVRRLVPELAAAFGPDLIVSQHGADSHAWDPLAHLRMTTTAMDEAARLVDAVAHRYRGRPVAGDRWRRLRRVPGRAADVEPGLARRVRTWTCRIGRPRPGASDGRPRPGGIASRRCPRRSSTHRTRACRSTARRTRPRRCRSRWSSSSGGSSCPGSCARHGPRLVGSAGRQRRGRIGAEAPDRCRRDRPAPSRSSPTSTPRPGRGLSLAARVDRAVRRATGPCDRGRGASPRAPASRRPSREPSSSAWPSTGPDDALLALGVAPDHRRAGLATALLRASHARTAEVTVAERDPDRSAARMRSARRSRAGSSRRPGSASRRPRPTSERVDPLALVATRD